MNEYWKNSRLIIRALVHMVLIWTYAASADVIATYEGNCITGIITNHSDSAVTVDVGLGSIVLHESQIEDIRLFESGQNDSLRNHWSREFFAMEQYVPQGFESLACEYRQLEAKRSTAISSRQRIQKLSEKRRDIERRLSDEEEELLEAYRRIRRLSASLIGTEYNRRVMDINRCRSSVALTQAEIASIDTEIDDSYHAIAEYLNSLRSIEQVIQDTLVSYRGSGVSGEVRFFLDTLDTRLRRMADEFQRMKIPYQGLSDGRIVVTAIINNEKAGKFLVDTGASAVAVSKRFYESLTDTVAGSRPVTIAMADGTQMGACQITLRSVQVGNAHLDNVTAVVLDQGPSMGNDGVLGMSFLGHYGITIDSVQGRLVLEEYTPVETASDMADTMSLSIQPIFE